MTKRNGVPLLSRTRPVAAGPFRHPGLNTAFQHPRQANDGGSTVADSDGTDGA